MKENLKQRCATRMTDRIIITQGKIKMLQDKYLLEGHTDQEIAAIWKEICDCCPPLNESGTFSDGNAEVQEEFTFEDSWRNNTKPENDICVVFGSNGTEYAR